MSNIIAQILNVYTYVSVTTLTQNSIKNQYYHTQNYLLIQPYSAIRSLAHFLAIRSGHKRSSKTKQGRLIHFP